jgi:hypothetical protein
MTIHSLGPLQISVVHGKYRQNILPQTNVHFQDRIVRVQHRNVADESVRQYDVPALDILQEIYFAIVEGQTNPKQHVVFDGYDQAIAFETVADEIIFGDNSYKLLGRQNKEVLLDLTIRYLAGEVANAVLEGRMTSDLANHLPVQVADVPRDQVLVLT